MRLRLVLPVFIAVVSATPTLAAVGCYPAPPQIVGWWSFDETAPGDARDRAYGNSAKVVGPVQYVSGEVKGAYRMVNTAVSRVEVPGAPQYDFGTGSLSIDAWIRPLDNLAFFDFRPIWDSHFNHDLYESGHGYAFYIKNDCLAFMMNNPDGTLATFYSPTGLIKNAVWQHVAVTIARDACSRVGRFYYNGALVATFKPTAAALSGGAIIGVGNLGSWAQPGTLNHCLRTPLFNGDLDEVQVFSRAITPAEVLGIYQAGPAGKCDVNCWVPGITTLCSVDSSASSYFVICNHSGVQRSFAWSLAGVPLNLYCETPGPTAFSPSSGVVPVDGGACVSVPFEVHRPPGLQGGLDACYELDLTENDYPVCSSQGALTIRNGPACPERVSGIYADESLVAFPWTNPTGIPDTVTYRIVAKPAAADTTGPLLGLDNLPPGEAVTGQIVVTDTSTVSVGATLKFGAHDPFRLYDVQLLARDPVTQAYVPVADVPARSDQPTYATLIDCNGNGVSDSLDIAHGTSTDSDHDGVPDECEVDTGGPPQLYEVYPIGDHVVRIVYDREVTTASATNPVNYALGSLGTVDAVTQEDAATYRATITSDAAAGDIETISTNGIVNLATGVPMTTPQSKSFINGVLRPEDVQAPDPGFLASCIDRSRYAGSGGTRGLGLAVRGTVNGQFGSMQTLESSPGSLRQGLMVNGVASPLVLGHEYLLSGSVQEFESETQLVPSFVVDEGAASPPVPVAGSIAVFADTTCDASQQRETGEDYEGLLVKLIGGKLISQVNPCNYRYFVVGPYPAGGDTLEVMNLGGVLDAASFPGDGTLIDVTGILHASAGGFAVCPRSADDIALSSVSADGGTAQTGRIELTVYPNPSQTTRFRFSLPERAKVDLSLYDVGGRRLATLVQRTLDPGSYTEEWRAEITRAIPKTGVYFARLTVGPTVLTRRFVLVR